MSSAGRGEDSQRGNAVNHSSTFSLRSDNAVVQLHCASDMLACPPFHLHCPSMTVDRILWFWQHSQINRAFLSPADAWTPPCVVIRQNHIQNCWASTASAQMQHKRMLARTVWHTWWLGQKGGFSDSFLIMEIPATISDISWPVYMICCKPSILCFTVNGSWSKGGVGSIINWALHELRIP